MASPTNVDLNFILESRDISQHAEVTPQSVLKQKVKHKLQRSTKLKLTKNLIQANENTEALPQSESPFCPFQLQTSNLKKNYWHWLMLSWD